MKFNYREREREEREKLGTTKYMPKRKLTTACNIIAVIVIFKKK